MATLDRLTVLSYSKCTKKLCTQKLSAIVYSEPGMSRLFSLYTNLTLCMLSKMFSKIAKKSLFLSKLLLIYIDT